MTGWSWVSYLRNIGTGLTLSNGRLERQKSGILNEQEDCFEKVYEIMSRDRILWKHSTLNRTIVVIVDLNNEWFVSTAHSLFLQRCIGLRSTTPIILRSEFHYYLSSCHAAPGRMWLTPSFILHVLLTPLLKINRYIDTSHCG